MTEYRAFLFGADGHIYCPSRFEGEDHAQALVAARQYVDGREVEL